jgi:predicted flap endonuclease-1-like 5' DNA nuclease
MALSEKITESGGKQAPNGAQPSLMPMGGAAIFSVNLTGQLVGGWLGALQAATETAQSFWQRQTWTDPAQGTAAPLDDLKLLSGVGPKLEKVLRGRGVSTYAQIAAWTPSEIDEIDALLGSTGRVAREGWVEQAGILKSGKTKR